MKIVDKVLQSHDDILNGRDGESNAGKLGFLAAEALFDGIKSRKWEAYMKNFASNPAQLARLCGEDDFFDGGLNKLTLAYLVGNSICTIATHRGEGNVGTLNNISPDMLDALDAGLDSKTGLESDSATAA